MRRVAKPDTHHPTDPPNKRLPINRVRIDVFWVSVYRSRMNEQIEKRGPGRPPGKTPKHTFRMPDDEWEIVRAAADVEGENASEYIRRVVLAHAKRVVKRSADH